MAQDKSKEPEMMHLLIDGYVYDITSFMKKHPGGSVIRYYKNMDATDVFHAFHERSEKASKWLKTLPRKEASKSEIKIKDDAQEPIVADFRKLREELRRDGLYAPIWEVQFIRLMELLFLHILAFYVTINYSSILGGILYGFVIGRNGLLMHDMGHRAFFCNMTLDKIAHLIIFGTGITGSANYWVNQHSKHHAATQELKHDVDLATLPVLAFHKDVAKMGNPYWLRYQWIFFLPAQLMVFPFWKILHFYHNIRSRNFKELAFILSHDLIAISLMFTSSLTIPKYLIMEAIGYPLGSFYLTTTFSINHTHRPVVQPFSQRNWVRRATDFTTNSDPTYFTTWYTGYLNYQIEHHLFPTISHPRLPEVSKRVRALCEKHNVHYDIIPILEAFKLTFYNLYTVGEENYKEAASIKPQPN